MSKRKKYGVPSSYVAGSKNPKAKAAEIKDTSRAYKEKRRINIEKVVKSRIAQGKDK